jgi:hypothetical protein
MNTGDMWRAMLRMEVGAKAALVPVEGNNLTPMSIVIRNGQKSAKCPVTVWWADDGPPSMFCLEDGTSTAILFSTRCLQLDAQARWLVGNTSFRAGACELAYRLSLTRLSEHLLMLGQHRLALSAVLESIREQTIFAPFCRRWQDLEYLEVDEAYMALWFFGLGHEFGHVLSNGALSSSPLASRFEEIAESAVTKVLSELIWPIQIKRLLVERAHSAESSLSIHPSSLREECLADVGACSLLHESSQEALQLLGREMDFASFAWEMLAVGVVRSFNDSALALARVVSDPNPTSHALTALSSLVAVNVRLVFRRLYLEHSWATAKDSAYVSAYLDAMVGQLQEDCKTLEDSMGAAARFLLLSKETEPTILPSWLKPSIVGDITGEVRTTLKVFVSLARSFSTDCSEIHALGSLIDA